MARTIAQIVKAARELGPQNLTPAEFRVLKALEKAKKEEASKDAASAESPVEEPERHGKGNKGWYTRQQMAEFFGFTIVQFDRAVRPDMEPSDIRKVKNKLLFRGRGAIDAYVLKCAPARKNAGEDDMFSDADSPALERYRSIKADLAQIELDERRGNSIRIEDAKAVLSILANNVRNAGDQLQREYGPEAGDILNESLDEALAVIERTFGPTQPATPETHPSTSKVSPPTVAEPDPATLAHDASVPQIRPGGEHTPGVDPGPATTPSRGSPGGVGGGMNLFWNKVSRPRRNSVRAAANSPKKGSSGIRVGRS